MRRETWRMVRETAEKTAWRLSAIRVCGTVNLTLNREGNAGWEPTTPGGRQQGYVWNLRNLTDGQNKSVNDDATAESVHGAGRVNPCQS